MIQYKIVDSVPASLYGAILIMIHESFEEHKKKGLNFTCSQYTMRDVKDRVLSAKYFIALSDDNQILGLTSLSDMGEGKAYENISAVSPKAKGTGIGTALYQTRSEFLKKNHYSCIISDTATNATSSVNWHLKKCGCHIIGYASFSSTNYYSFIFREDLNDRGWIVNHIVYPLHFLISYLATRLTKQQDGRYTKLGKIVRYIIDLKRERKNNSYTQNNTR